MSCTTNRGTDRSVILAWTTAPCINCSFIVDTPSFTVNLVAQVATPTFTVVETPVTTPVVFTPSTGTFIGTQAVTLTTATPAPYEIRYTVDGTAPNAGSLLYSVPLNLSATTRVRAIAVKAAYTTGAETEATYTLSVPTVANVLISPAVENFFDEVEVTLSCATEISNPPVAMYYTLNGVDPTNAVSGTNFLYSGPFTVNSNLTVKAKAYKTYYTASAVTSQAYTEVVPTTIALNRTAPATVFWIAPTNVVVNGGTAVTAPDGLVVNVGASANLYVEAFGACTFNVIYNGLPLFGAGLSTVYNEELMTYYLSANTALSGAAAEIRLAMDADHVTYPAYFNASEEVLLKIYAY